MKTSYVLIGIAVLIIIVGALFWFSQNKAEAPTTSPATTQSTTAAAPTTGTANNTAPIVSGGVTVTTVTTTSNTPAPQHFTVNGNDTTADVMQITVPKGTPVSITFGADAQGTYHGGLDFRSSVVNTGTIAPGATKTVSFTATQSFIFQPYWPATNIAKPYHITVTVD